jgi:aryl-alcohol dehydrogenase-like predicted oxidoreductase
MTIWTGADVPRIGVGCWAIGGDFFAGAAHTSYGETDDTQSIAGLRLADEMGAKVFDTAAAYGGGHSEQLLGQVFGDRSDIVIVSKFGYPVDPVSKQAAEADLTPAGIRASVEQSRRNLRRDCIDLMLFHINGYPAADAGPVFDTLGRLRNEGKIKAFGWSTDNPQSLAAFADREGFVAVENDYNVFQPAEELMAIAEKKDLVSISRLPLAMGMLTGKYSQGQSVGPKDIRSEPMDWMTFFKAGKANPDYVRRLEAIREVLTTGGRTLAQGALGWILARSAVALPVPGFKTPAQIRDNLGALAKGPLPKTAMREIDELLSKEMAA